jgi:hypothetical protein
MTIVYIQIASVFDYGGTAFFGAILPPNSLAVSSLRGDRLFTFFTPSSFSSIGVFMLSMLVLAVVVVAPAVPAIGAGCSSI